MDKIKRAREAYKMHLVQKIMVKSIKANEI